jgi:hypothetical protein
MSVTVVHHFDQWGRTCVCRCSSHESNQPTHTSDAKSGPQRCTARSSRNAWSAFLRNVVLRSTPSSPPALLTVDVRTVGGEEQTVDADARPTCRAASTYSRGRSRSCRTRSRPAPCTTLPPRMIEMRAECAATTPRTSQSQRRHERLVGGAQRHVWIGEQPRRQSATGPLGANVRDRDGAQQTSARSRRARESASMSR